MNSKEEIPSGAVGMWTSLRKAPACPHTHSLYGYYATSNSLRVDHGSGKDLVNVTGLVRR